ncbi:hypothetical protein RvY_19315 [Ramazzottius varieornatus]|uniref:Rab3 GTPase-activating protein catalytic subunit n=1 Tax=Ramazzottius varieornatus TaxID=947166 RepID=A0A1D1W900_RAMVA|nr:hypothetical protein RvY_19315 [Ramazzottius varieornatus]
MLSTENDFPLSATLHPLARWFGLADFVVMTSSPFNKIDYKVSEDRLKILHSSIVMAVSNTKCPIPMFLQFDEPLRQMFVGVSEVSGFRTLYEIIDLQKIPERLQTLSGLLEIFKGKIGVEDSTQLIKASIQFTIDLLPDTIEFEDTPEENEDSSLTLKLGSIPFGPEEFNSFVIHLFTSWPNANADAIEDTLLHSDLEPLQAPKWAAQLVFEENATYKIAETIKTFAKQTHRRESIHSFLEYLEKEQLRKEEKEQAAEVLERLTAASPRDHLRSRLSKAIYSRLPKYHLPVPIDAENLNDILAYIFPDSDLAKEMGKSYLTFTEPPDNIFKGAKAAPCDSLAFRLALAVFFVYERFGGVLAVAYLWQEVILELRYRWENGLLIAGVDGDMPNHGTCLLHQKLQMLKCCIIKRQAGSGSTGEASPQGMQSSSSMYMDTQSDVMTDDEDEFFDCETDDEDKPRNSTHIAVLKPEGRKEAHPTLRLLHNPEVSIFIPVTQEPAPMTEDVAREHLEKLVATEEEAEGKANRIRLQSVALVSDMSAFKAANPGCVFEDFVRWHSPRDWEEESGTSRLSERMSQAGTAWKDAWEAAEGKSVRRQKRLFDERVEAENVLSFMDMLIGEVFRHTLPMLMKAGLIRLFEEMDSLEVTVQHDKRTLAKMLSRLFSEQLFSWTDFENFITSLRSNEQALCAYKSMRRLSAKSAALPEHQTFTNFLRQLVEDRQLRAVPGGARSPLGQHIAVCFDQGNQSRGGSSSGNVSLRAQPPKRRLPSPAVRQFILRTVAPRPYLFSRPSIHRMFASLSERDIRIAGAFSEDLLYG